jgi:16S rRNA (uracil1498-N3)-methyltransferase
MSHFYLPGPWPQPGVGITDELVLDTKLSHHLRVRRIQVNEQFRVFDGCGHTALATMVSLDKKGAVIRLQDVVTNLATETKVPMTLAQGMASSDKMDWLIEKSIEVGIAGIIPLQTERSVVRLDGERAAKKLEHWQGVITSACEQSGRTVLPKLDAVHNLPVWLSGQNPHDGQLRLLLSPRAEHTLLSVVKKMPPQATTLLIGPEGGLSETEEEQAKRAGFTPVGMGQRILRTETAAIVAMTAIHTIWNQP